MKQTTTRVPERWLRTVDGLIVPAAAVAWWTGNDWIGTAAVLALAGRLAMVGEKGVNAWIPRLRVTTWIYWGWIVWMAASTRALLHLPPGFALSAAAAALVYYAALSTRRGGEVLVRLWLILVALLPLPYVSTFSGPVKDPGYLQALVAGLAVAISPFWVLMAVSELRDLAARLRPGRPRQP